MSRARFFLTGEMDSSAPALVPLSTEDAHHAVRVLRVTPGEELDLIAPSGSGHRVEVTAVSDEGITARVLTELEAAWYPQITLFQGVAKGEKMDSIVRQAVEVGVARIVPVITSRTVVRLDEPKRSQRAARWRRIAESASKQARRERVVDVADAASFSATLGLLGAYDHVIVLWEDYAGTLLCEVASAAFEDANASVALCVGPEGGFAAEEVEALVSIGAVVASLGPSIMRTETAAVVSVALAVAAAHHQRTHRDR